MRRVVLQSIAFILALALLAWCVHEALAPENRDQLARLRDASTGQIALLLALSALSVVLNGLLFWIALRPVRRLRASDICASNAVATFLNYLPAKAGMLSRVLIHTRRDRVPFFMLGAWFTAVMVLTLGPLAVLVGASLLRTSADTVWAALVGVGFAAFVGAVVGCARIFEGERGLGRLESLLRAVRLGGATKLTRTQQFRNLHAGFAMLSSPLAVAGGAGIRFVDLLVQTARVVVAAQILGFTIALPKAVPLASIYFLGGVLSPAGSMGVREALTAQFADATAGFDETFMVATMLVTATEAISLIVLSILGTVWLRPDRWLARPVVPAAEGGSEAEAGHVQAVPAGPAPAANP